MLAFYGSCDVGNGLVEVRMREYSKFVNPFSICLVFGHYEVLRKMNLLIPIVLKKSLPLCLMGELGLSSSLHHIECMEMELPPLVALPPIDHSPSYQTKVK